MKILFTDYIIRKKERKTVIKSILVYTGLEKFGVNMFGLIGFLLIFLYFPLFTEINLFLYVVIKIIFGIFAFLVAKHFILRLLALTIFEIDSGKHIIKSNLDNFHIDFADIQNVSIVEEILKEGDEENIDYRLQFLLKEGEKTSVFAFTSYNKLQEILKFIKSSLQKA